MFGMNVEKIDWSFNVTFFVFERDVHPSSQKMMGSVDI
jgi:hypothetical protein